MVTNGHSRNHHKYLPWPEVTSAKAIPSPYQIFNQRKGSPYSKQRFYELVKLYHPDRHNVEETSDFLPYETKLERYRLVIAANDILSDPIKRGAYDLYGAGWNGQPGVISPNDSSDGPTTWGHYNRRSWAGPDGPSQNATWEDWERWYQRDAKGKQEPTYVSNIAFVSLIVIFAALGGIGQATRVGNYSVSALEQRDALHDNMSKELNRRRKVSNTYGSRDERIRQFLRQRDPLGYLADPHEPYVKLLSSGESNQERSIHTDRSTNDHEHRK